MRIPRFWAIGRCDGRNPATGERMEITAPGWSFSSSAAAASDAQERANRIAERLGAGETPTPYGYFDRPIREEIKESLACNGEEHGLITRNHYGALVLNSSRVLFADIDFPYVQSRGLWDGLRLSLSRGYRERRQRELEDATWRRVRRWMEANALRGFRLYRTARGLRLAITDRVYEATEPDATALLAEVGSDPLYRKLTQAQECFRARLTPKPRRCGYFEPPHRFPFPDAETEKRYREWEAEYERLAEGYRACELLGQYGDGNADEIMAQTIRIHDDRACHPQGAPLA